MLRIALITVCISAAGNAALGQTDLVENTPYSVVLQGQDGTEIDVADLTFDRLDNGNWTYALTWDDTKFSDQFLSMRPFKCLDGPEKQWCRVPYPYPNRHQISARDMTDLEYDLLFIWKRQGDYGIDMWNGVYYRLDPGARTLAGAMHEMDMDILSAPPDEGDLRPITEADLEPADPESHWLPVLELRPEN